MGRKKNPQYNFISQKDQENERMAQNAWIKVGNGKENFYYEEEKKEHEIIYENNKPQYKQGSRKDQEQQRKYYQTQQKGGRGRIMYLKKNEDEITYKKQAPYNKQDQYQQKSGYQKGGRRNRRRGYKKDDMSWQTSFGFLQHLKDFNKDLFQKGFCLYDVIGDGNCLYRAIADQLLNDQNQHEKYRTICVEQLEAKKDFYKLFAEEDNEDFDEYIKETSKNGEWGGNLELQAICESLGIMCIVHQKDKDDTTVYAQDKDIDGVIHIAYTVTEDCDGHYSSVKDSSQQLNNELDTLNIK